MSEFHLAGMSWAIVLSAGILFVLVQAASGAEPSTVCNVKVVSDKIEDVSSIEAWKAAVIRPGMTDEEKALAVWETVVKFRHQNPPPKEFRHGEDGDFCVHDAIKTFNVYGYGMCCCAASNVKSLARAVGLPARGRALHAHSLPEVFYGGSWHVLDASFINYFRNADGEIASFEDIFESVAAWYQMNRDFRGRRGKLREFMKNGAWRAGPPIFTTTDFIDQDGMLPAGTHGWHSLMTVYDGEINHPWEFGYSQGYRLNVRLRPGERLVRNWSNRGLHVNMDGAGQAPDLDGRIGEGDLKYADDYGDIAPGRVGNGTRQWRVPLEAGVLERCSLEFENLRQGGLREPALCTASPDEPGVFVIDMPSSYVYLDGELRLGYTLGIDGAVRVLFSRNNGLDWREIYVKTGSGAWEQTVDLKPFIRRLYDYRLKFELAGKGTGLNMLEIRHDIQHSQRALPALGPGKNTITFSARPADESTVTVQGLPQPEVPYGMISALEYHPALEGVECTARGFEVTEDGGTVTFAVETPGEMRRLRFGCFTLAAAKEDGWDFLVSFDDGANWTAAGRAGGQVPGISRYVTFEDVPAGARRALVRFAGGRAGGAIMVEFRIDADYALMHGGFRPVAVTYLWQEAGERRRHEHVAREPEETYTIECGEAPVMRSLVMEPGG